MEKIKNKISTESGSVKSHQLKNAVRRFKTNAIKCTKNNGELIGE